jgi:hypothetical protein
MAHMYIQYISITIHFLLSTLLIFSWAGWLSSTLSVRYNRQPPSKGPLIRYFAEGLPIPHLSDSMGYGLGIMNVILVRFS